MMQYYIEITLLPSADIEHYFLWEKVYQQLHLALVERQQVDKTVPIGVSFPEYCQQHKTMFQLGAKLRLFATSSATLDELKITKWLSRLTDYVQITSLREVPNNKIVGYAYFKRVQLKNNTARLARRRASRHGISYDTALAFFETRKKRVSRTAFIHIKSHSSGQKFQLHIEKVDADKATNHPYFSTYGLSSEATVPLF
jgi:CRISPR-associated endonuclease Csy4